MVGVYNPGMQKFIYVIAMGEGSIKIGITDNVLVRFKSHQTSNPNLLKIITCRLVDDADELEQEILKEYAPNALYGEWLKIDSKQVVEICIKIHSAPAPQEAIIKSYGAGIIKRLNKIEKQQTWVIAQAKKNIEKELKAKYKSKIKLLRHTPRAKRILENGELIEKARAIKIDIGKTPSISLLQRKLNIGYNRAANIAEQVQ